MAVMRVRSLHPRWQGRLRALVAEKTRDQDYVYVVWFDGPHYHVSGFLDPARLVQWLKQEATAGRLPERIELR